MHPSRPDGSETREASTEHARLVLTAAGFTVDDIAVAKGEKRADLRLRFEDEEYVLEAKLREPHAGWVALMKEADAKGYASTSRTIDPWNALSSTIREANQQLIATPAGPNAFRVLWAIALHDDDEYVVACLEKRLLGTQLLLAVGEPNLENLKPIDCYYYARNDFERCPQMDAAVLGTQRGANLFVNYYSDRREAFRRSHLHRMFEEKRAVVDAEVLVAQNEALMIGRDLRGPRDAKSKWTYLMDRFGVATSAMLERQFSGVATVPVKALTSK